MGHNFRIDSVNHKTGLVSHGGQVLFVQGSEPHSPQSIIEHCSNTYAVIWVPLQIFHSIQATLFLQMRIAVDSRLMFPTRRNKTVTTRPTLNPDDANLEPDGDSSESANGHKRASKSLAMPNKLKLSGLHRSAQHVNPLSNHENFAIGKSDLGQCSARKSRKSLLSSDVRLDQIAHFVQFVKKKQRCAMCKTSIIHSKCIKCDVHLCVQNKNCFIAYHTGNGSG